jgi:DUF438 domain-containing protein
MNIPDTNVSIEFLLDRLPIGVHFVDKDGYLRYQNKVVAARSPNGESELGVNIWNCHKKAESIKSINLLFGDFRKGRKEPHYRVTSEGRKSVKVPIFDTNDEFIGVLSFDHPVGVPEILKTY